MTCDGIGPGLQASSIVNSPGRLQCLMVDIKLAAGLHGFRRIVGLVNNRFPASIGLFFVYGNVGAV
jgi:hypothetical protein